ncbi:MAG: SDR family NAD(P)-dependent oxidoreductase [Acidimicrobiales bacterium]
MDLGLQGKTALVTGSYRGTGRGIARVLAAEGAEVVVHGLEQAPAEAVAAELRAAGGSARAVAGDLLTDAGVDELCRRCGPVDIAVANYGVAEGGSWFGEATDEAAWFDSYNKNVLSAVRLVRATSGAMAAKGAGRIILVGTVGSFRPGTRNPQYYAAKGALPAITTSLAKELAGTGITVNLVSPGIIATDEIRERFTERAARQGRPTDWESVQQLIFEEFMAVPTRRVPDPEDVGKLVAFLAGEPGAHITGANYRIDGGAADAVAP